MCMCMCMCVFVCVCVCVTQCLCVRTVFVRVCEKKNHVLEGVSGNHVLVSFKKKTRT